MRCRHAVPSVILCGILGAAPAAHAQISINKLECACGNADANLEALRKDRDNARHLRDDFRQESQRLGAKYGRRPNESAAQASRQEEQAFAKQLEGQVSPPPGYTGPPSSRYVSLGSTTGQNVPKGHECDPDNDSIDNLQRVLDGSVCAGMARAIKVHEQFHWDTCRRISDKVYWRRTGAQIADEEAQAYDAQVKVLDKEIKSAEKSQRPVSAFSAYAFPGSVMSEPGGCLRKGNDQMNARP
jgi:hypothetical protein